MRQSITISRPKGTEKAPPLRRGRPRKFDAPEALRKAMIIFWEKGYHATSYDDLTTSTGLQKSSLYAAFGDKASLFLACLERYGELVGSSVMAAIQNGATPSACLQSFFNQVIRSMTASKGPRGCLLVCVLSELASTEPSLRKRLQEIILGNDHFISERLRQTGFAGDCDRAGMIASTLAIGYTVRARSGESRSSLLESIPAAVDMVLSA